MSTKLFSSVIWVFLLACQVNEGTNEVRSKPEVYVKVLGIAQDAGYPQIDCQKECCRKYWNGLEEQRLVVSLGLVDQRQNRVWMFEATPDFKEQYTDLMGELDAPDEDSFGGVFLTHAHMGHYTGLMQLGFEAMNASNVPVYVMPRMKNYLESNGPWGQLVTKGNISLIEMSNEMPVQLQQNLGVAPVLVPHRDEYSETVGYIVSLTKQVLFIPDINKWSIWEKDIVEQVKSVDRAYLDASFLNSAELPGRDMSQIPHPFVSETMELFDSQSLETKSKVEFIHFNHTNKLLFEGPVTEEVRKNGYNIARKGSIFSLN